MTWWLVSIVHLSAGTWIPADVRILDAKDLFVSQASLTGESEPVEKLPHVSPHKDSVTDYTNIAFMGSNVISGSATAVVICVGDHTLLALWPLLLPEKPWKPVLQKVSMLCHGY